MKMERVVCWVWLGATLLLALGSLAIVFAAGLYLSARAEFGASAPTRLPGLYLALKENGVLVAGLTGFSALAWVLWFRPGSRPR